MKFPRMTNRQCAEVRRAIENAERALGKLTEGQLVDLLLDNCSWIEESAHAREILAAIGRKVA